MPNSLYTQANIKKVRTKIDIKRNFLLQTFFNKKDKSTTSKIILELTKSKEATAPFVTLLDKGKLMLANKTRTNMIEAPKIAISKPIDQSTLEGRPEGVALGNGEIEHHAKIMRKILLDQENYIINKEELMVSQFLTSGKVMNQEGEAGYEVDYGLGNIETLPMEKLWSKPEVDPIESLDRIIAKTEESGSIVEVIVMGMEAAICFTKNIHAQKLVSKDLQSEFVKEVTKKYPGVVWIGTYKTYGIELFRYKRSVLDLAGNKIDLMPDNVVIGGPKGGEIIYAPIMNTSNPKEAPLKRVERYSHVSNIEDSGLMITTTSRPMLNPMDVDGYFCVTVC